MSLLLQALRQIDSKLPVCATASAGPAICLSSPATAVAIEPVVSAPVVVQSAAADSIVVAPFAALTEKPVAARSQARQPLPATPADRWLADQVTAVLKPADRVLAIVAADTAGKTAGKTAGFAANLALGLADRDERGVLMIELIPESRRRLLGVTNVVKLIDLVEGQTSWAEALGNAADRRLRVLPVAASAGDDRISAGDLRRSWQAALDEAHYLVFDTSGLDEAPFTGISCSCDAAILVVRKGQTARHRARRQAERLRQAGANLRACMFIDA